MQYSIAQAIADSSPQQIDCATYIGLDVHNDTIAVAVAYPGRDAPYTRREIANRPKAIDELVVRCGQAGRPAIRGVCAASCCQVIGSGRRPFREHGALLAAKKGVQRKRGRLSRLDPCVLENPS